MIMHRLKYFLIVIFAVFAGNAMSQDTLRLETAIATGLEKNYSIRIAKKELQVSENNNTVGNAGFLPTIDISLDKTYQTQNVDLELQSSEGTFGITRDWAKSDRLNSSAALNWTIFDGLGMFITKDKLEELERSGRLNSQISVENTTAAIISAYYRIVLEQATVNVLEQTMEISGQRMELAKSRYDVGKGSKMEYLTAQVDYNTDRSNLLVQEVVLKNAKIDLNVLMGKNEDFDYKVVDSIDVDDQLIYEQLEERIKTANPQLLLAKNDQNVAYLEYKELVSDRYPTFDVNVAYGYGTSNNEAGQLRRSTTDGLTYGFSASWNIFDGFNKNREIQNARIRREVTGLAQEQLELDLTSELRKSYINYSNSLNLINLETENVEVAIENEKIAIDRYELGVGTPLELREAQRNAVDARRRLLDAKLVAKLAEIELLRLSSGLISSGN